jgi:3-methyl-2-oxobutanoate hydroxymethyltransferase
MMTVLENFKKLKAEGNKIVVVTSYDYWSAKILNGTDINGILIGDCSSMVMHGHENTLSSDVDIIAMHTRAVKKGAKDKFLIAAMPFMSNRKNLIETMNNVEILIKAGANALKIEGVDGNEELFSHLTQSGIPTIGHIGLTPSHHNAIGGFKSQGKTRESELRLVEEAKKLERLGCIAIVLEAVPRHVGASVRDSVSIPVVGVGAGLEVDGQALVLQDMLGLSTDFKPKFVRTYLNGAELIINAVNKFTSDVKLGSFPSEAETYPPSKEQVKLK